MLNPAAAHFSGGGLTDSMSTCETGGCVTRSVEGDDMHGRSAAHGGALHALSF